jgi:[acyl-carrier-protein] S-malonyltransferase
MQFLVGAGVTRFLELGPGNVLAGLLKRVSREVEVRSIGTADEAEAFLNT